MLENLHTINQHLIESFAPKKFNFSRHAITVGIVIIVLRGFVSSNPRCEGNISGTAMLDLKTFPVYKYGHK